MFRQMRRPQQMLLKSQVTTVLDTRTSGVLALQGDDGYPYAVPLSFARDGDKLYFHSAPQGYKLEAVERDAKACFCVIDRDDVEPEEFLTRYRSVIAFGRVRIVRDADGKRHALRCIAQKYSADHLEKADALIEETLDNVAVLELTIEHITGKRSPDPVQ